MCLHWSYSLNTEKYSNYLFQVYNLPGILESWKIHYIIGVKDIIVECIAEFCFKTQLSK